MSAPQPSRCQWGTEVWFSRNYAKGDSRDPAAYFAHTVNGYQVFRHRYLIDWLQAALQGKQIDILLDIGCGTGALTALIEKQQSVSHAVGVDFVEDAIDEARASYPSIEFMTDMLPSLSFPANSFDLVVASEVLYYLGEDERERAMAEIERVLRPQGFLFFTSRLGGRYFSVKSAEALLTTRLRIEKRGFFHNSLYNGLIKPLRGARGLSGFTSRGIEPENPKLAWIARRFAVLLSNPVSRFCLKQVGAFERWVLRSSRFPAICHRLSKLFIPRPTCSNIILLARKD